MSDIHCIKTEMSLLCPELKFTYFAFIGLDLRQIVTFSIVIYVLDWLFSLKTPFHVDRFYL